MENGLNYQEFVGTDDNQCCPSCGCIINPMDMTCRYCGEAIREENTNAASEIKLYAVEPKTLKSKAKALGFKKGVSRYFFIALIALIVVTSILSSSNIPEFIRKIPGEEYIGWMIIIDLIAFVIIAVIAVIRGKKLENKARKTILEHPVRSHHYLLIKNDLSIFRVRGYYTFRHIITDSNPGCYDNDIVGINSIIGIRNNYTGAICVFILFALYMSFGKVIMGIHNKKPFDNLLGFAFVLFLIVIPILVDKTRAFALKRTKKLLKSVYIDIDSYPLFGQAALSKNTKYSYEESEKIMWCYLLGECALSLKGFSVGAAVLKHEKAEKENSSGCSSCSSCSGCGGCGGGCGGCGD
ncbi:MAG: hypothetical protein IJU01_00170 [Lachnospiraceae bacterium]|nr:hypothetical protein [Lachnospiraceae bacterium]